MSVEGPESRLRLLGAELEEEVSRVGRLAGQFDVARVALEDPECELLRVYGVAALLESFYTGMEKAFRRIASTLGGMPRGENWHRDLLASMTLDIEGLRPVVLRRETLTLIDPFLAFRHRFRNLYVFDLEREPMSRLLELGPRAFEAFASDIRAFCEELRAGASRLAPKT